MSSVASHFDAYSAYYDLLYRDKDYVAESAFVLERLRTGRPPLKRVLDLGCGTGAHGRELARAGLAVHGIDLSATMLERAREKAAASPDIAPLLSYAQGDMREFEAPGHFDAAIAMFDVVGYLTSNADVASALRCIARHLRPGSTLIFDVWYGPAVYTMRPGTRVRRLESDHFRVTRIAEAAFHTERNLIDVRYELFIEDKASGAILTLNELHPVRCFFDAELDAMLAQHGFERIFATQLVNGREPSASTWSVLFGYRLAY